MESNYQITEHDEEYFEYKKLMRRIEKIYNGSSNYILKRYENIL